MRSNNMEPPERNHNADGSDAKPSFRKPSNDASGRNYRRHSPMGGSDASLSNDSPKRGFKNDTFSSREDPSKMTDKKRRNDADDLDRDRRCKDQRDGDSHRHFDRQTYMTSHNHHRNDGYGRDHRDDCERSYHRSSKSAHDLKDSDPSPYRRKDSSVDRSKVASQKFDKFYKDKSDNVPRNEDKIVIRAASQNHGYNDSNSALSGSRQINSRKDDEKTAEYDRYRDRQTRDDRRDRYRNPEDYNSNHRSYGEVRSRVKDSGSRDLDGHEETLNRRKRDRREYDRDRDLYDKESEEHIVNKNRSSSGHQERQRKNAADEAGQGSKGHDSPWKKKSEHSEGPTENAQILQESKEVSEVEKPNASYSKFSSEPTIPSISQVDVAPNHGAATVAAMKAAEIVNRNLLGGLSITDQKKKLLWGNKKSVEESSSRWDLSLFPDRERQEKFKKLMGVKGDVKLETKQDDKDGNLRAKKQEELQMDLEKQYTAGLRRRDGRTVGLGL